MHRLQQHILQQLILNPSLRYTRLKPREIEGNLFMYHLKQLMREGLVEKNETGHYQLSHQGKLYADTLSIKSLVPRAQPRIVTLMAIENGKGEWLFYKRKRQPLINMIGLPYGKIHLGESVGEAAERELEEKTGLRTSLEHRGDGYATTIEGGDPISEIFFHMFYSQSPVGELVQLSNSGEAFWAKPSAVKGDEYMPNVTTLLDLVQKSKPGQRFWAELSHDL